MREAEFYKKLNEKRVQCQLCPHFCEIATGQRGICGVRKNIKGVLYSLNYGKIAASHVVPIEKKKLFHFLPGTLAQAFAGAGCNLGCLFCREHEISQQPKTDQIIIGGNKAPAKIVATALDNRCRSIVYTYTEPTVFFEYAYDTAWLAHKKGLRNIFVTNGFMCPEALHFVSPYLDAANVDLKSFREEFYREVCGGELAPVLATLKLMKKLNIWLEITTTIITGLNDSREELSMIAGFIKKELGPETPWHISAFRPVYKMTDRLATSTEVLQKAVFFGQEAGLKHIYATDLQAGNNYCPLCGNKLIERSGFQVIKNRVLKNKCPNCNTTIAGVWA